MSENQNSTFTPAVTGANKTSGIGYSDHEYDKAIHVLVERVTPSNEQAEVNVPKTRSRTGADGGKPDGLLYIPDVQDTFSCGVCGRLYNKLLPFLSHRIQHADNERGMWCELGDTCPMYYRPFRLREHYKKVHKLNLTEGTTQRSCRSTYRRKPSGGKGSASASPAKKPKSQKGKRSKDKQKVETAAPIPVSVVENVHCQTEGKNDDTEAVMERVSDVEEPQDQGQSVPNVTEDEGAATLPVGQRETAEAGEIIQLGTVGPDGKISYDETYIQVVHEGREPSETSPPEKSSEIVPDTCTVTEETAPGKEDIEKNSASNNKELDFYFLLVTSMVRGSSFMYGKQSFKCLHCDYKTFWKQAFIKHMKDNHADVLSQHEFIEMRSTEKSGDQKLMKMSEFVEFQTPSKRREKSIGQRMKGKAVSDKHGNYPCTSCSKVFNRWSYLRKHMRIHVPTRNFLCIECGKAFKTNTSLQQHLKTHQKEAYTCTVCGFKSNINAAIHAHRQFHNQGSVLCDICGNAYTDKSTLNKHKRVHDPSRPFGCPFPECTWRFKTEVMCNGHYRSHTSNAQFKCTLCGYEFRQKHHLRRHERQTHGIQHLKTRVHRSKVKTAEEEQAITNITVLHPNQISEVEPVGQILIPVTADGDGNPIPLEYKVGTLGSVNLSYQQVINAGFSKVDGNTIYLPLS